MHTKEIPKCTESRPLTFKAKGDNYDKDVDQLDLGIDYRIGSE